MRQLLDAVSAATADIKGKVNLMIGRGIISRANDGGAIQTAQVQLMDAETHDDVERIQQYGFTSVPRGGAEIVVAFVGGNRDHGLIIAVDDRRYRLTGLKEGEMAIHDDQGQKVHLTRDGIVIDGADKPISIKNTPKVDIDSLKVHMSGDLDVSGNITAAGDISDRGNKSMSGMRDAYDNHDHDNPEGGKVGKPNGRM